MRPVLVGVIALLGACKVAATFDCALDPQCGAGGTCQPTGYCSFADATCPSGQRYDEYAGSGLAGSCVADSQTPDAPVIDAPQGNDAPAPVDAFPPFVVRINVGGAAVTGVDYPGNWAGDPSASSCPGGGQFKVTGDIHGTVDDGLFQSIVYAAPTLTCRVQTVPVGMYQVRLLFAEVYFGCPGNPAGPHVFDVAFEGTTVRTGVSSIADGGGCAMTNGHPFEVVSTVPVVDDQLDIAVTVQSGMGTTGIIAAIELVRVQ